MILVLKDKRQFRVDEEKAREIIAIIQNKEQGEDTEIKSKKPKHPKGSILEFKDKYDEILNRPPRSRYSPPNRTTAHAINQPGPLSIS